MNFFRTDIHVDRQIAVSVLNTIIKGGVGSEHSVLKIKVYPVQVEISYFISRARDGVSSNIVMG